MSNGGDGAAVPGPTCAGAVTTSSDTALRVAALDVVGVLEEERACNGAPGALALVRNGGREWFGASGAADLAGAPIAEETTFRIASITKPIVAALGARRGGPR